MYEWLKTLELPGLSLSNWKSKIRHRVAIHDDYRDMPRWSGRETADIVYHDSDQRLTPLLVENGYLDDAGAHDPRSWVERRPTYYIEVKTTPGQLNIPFFCSQDQFDMMEMKQIPADSSTDEVYLIARVFGLGPAGMGLKLYVDPARLRRTGELTFTADKYAVRP